MTTLLRHGLLLLKELLLLLIVLSPPFLLTLQQVQPLLQHLRPLGGCMACT